MRNIVNEYWNVAFKSNQNFKLTNGKFMKIKRGISTLVFLPLRFYLHFYKTYK